jgi:hypothetical protein
MGCPLLAQVGRSRRQTKTRPEDRAGCINRRDGYGCTEPHADHPNNQTALRWFPDRRGPQYVA